MKNILKIFLLIFVFIGNLDARVQYSKENLLLNTLFFPISALSQKKYSSFTLVNSNTLFSQSLNLEKNRVFNNRFYIRKEVV